MVFKAFLLGLLVFLGGATNAATIRVLTVYSPGALAFFGGYPGIQQMTATQIATTNMAMDNSGVGVSSNGPSFVSAGTLYVADTKFDLAPEIALGYLEGSYEVIKARDLNNADIVMLINNYESPETSYIDARGIASQYNYSATIKQNAYSAFGMSTAQGLPFYSYQHELGHLLGAQHFGQASPFYAVPAYAYYYPGLNYRTCVTTLMVNDPVAYCGQQSGFYTVATRALAFSGPYTQSQAGILGNGNVFNAQVVKDNSVKVAQYHNYKLLEGVTVRLLSVPLFYMMQ